MRDRVPPCIGYCRVSSREQSDNTSALEQQMARVRAAGAEEILVDVESGRSSKEEDRVEFQRLMRLVEQGAIERVIVTRLDRLSRSLPTLRRILDTFETSRVVLVALDNSVDMSTAAGRFHLNMLGALAEMESDHLSERIKHGHAHFRNQKKVCHAPFGYKVENFRLIVDREPFICSLDDKKQLSKFDLSRWLIEAYIQIQSLGGTCRQFNVLFGPAGFSSIRALSAWLCSPVLRGHVVYRPKSKNPEIHHNQHEAILSESEYQTIKQILEFNARVGGFGFVKGRYSLTGLVRCDCCGKGCIIANGSGGKYKYFLCARSRTKGCGCNKGVRLETLEAAVIEALVQRAEEIAESANTPAQRTESNEIMELMSQLSVLENLGDNPAIVHARESLREQIQSMTNNRRSRYEVDEELQELLVSVVSKKDFWNSLPINQKKKFLRALVEVVVIRDGVLVGVDLLV